MKIQIAVVKNRLLNSLIMFIIALIEIASVVFGGVTNITLGEPDEENSNIFPKFFVSASRDCILKIFKENNMIYIYGQNVKAANVKIGKGPFYLLISIVSSIICASLLFMLCMPIFEPQASLIMVFSVGGILCATGIITLTIMIKRFAKISRYWNTFYEQKLSNIQYQKEL